MTLSLAICEEWIYSKLSADAQLTTWLAGRIYPAAEVPQGAITPYAVFQHIGGYTVNLVGKHRLLNEDVWLVKVVSKQGENATAMKAANRIDEILNFSSGTVTTGTVVSVVTTNTVAYPESDDKGTTYSHMGARYRFQSQAGSP